MDKDDLGQGCVLTIGRTVRRSGCQCVFENVGTVIRNLGGWRTSKSLPLKIRVVES